MITLGIDPGLNGAIALLGPAGLTIYDMPTITPKTKRVIDEIELARLIDLHASSIGTAFIEDVGVRPGEGAVGAFTFGRGLGVLYGILRAHFIPIEPVTPAKWKRALNIPAGAGKDASRALAKSLFQRDAALFSRVKDDGRAESALIARYGEMLKTRRAAA